MSEPPFGTCTENNIIRTKSNVISHANYTHCFIRFRNILALFGHYIVVVDRLIRDFPKITSYNTVFYTTERMSIWNEILKRYIINFNSNEVTGFTYENDLFNVKMSVYIYKHILLSGEK